VRRCNVAQGGLTLATNLQPLYGIRTFVLGFSLEISVTRPRREAETCHHEC